MIQRRLAAGVGFALTGGFASAPFAMRIPRAFIQASKSSARILRPFWVISKRLESPIPIGVFGGGSGAFATEGARLAQPDNETAAASTGNITMRIEQDPHRPSDYRGECMHA
jgi:hypothetical protein